MEYAQQANVGTRPTADVAARPLDSLAQAVIRVNSASVRVQDFLDRFHGSKDPGALAGAEGRPEPTYPHRENIGRLFEALDRLESRIADLGQIG